MNLFSRLLLGLRSIFSPSGRSAPKHEKNNMPTRVPSFFILVPGSWSDASILVERLKTQSLPTVVALPEVAREAGQLRVDIIEDNNLARACSWGRRGRLAEDLLKEVERCSKAALIECCFLLHEEPALMARLGRALKDAGGILVRMEASGSASAWEPWIEAMDSGLPWQIYCASVLMVGGDEGEIVTCGMHQFDLPDACIPMPDAAQAISWLDVFCVYQIAEKPLLQSGHTFSPDADTPRRKIERWPDSLHSSTDGRNNPFGVWKVLELGQTGVSASDLLPVMVPALISMLSEAERNKGSKLTRDEVEKLRDQSPCIAMKPADASQMERSRGYADILPERAWEQWQLLSGLRP